MGVTVFLPTRKGSERVINKNTRPFAGREGGLLALKLDQLLGCKNVDEIILSSNDEASLELGRLYAEKDSRLKVVVRPDHLALSTTSLVDLVMYVPEVVGGEHILWTHVTSPFVTSEDYYVIIEDYLKALPENDSLMTVKKIQNFLWDADKHDLVNRQNDEKWPRTQDLKPFYEIDSAVFLSSKANYQSFEDRIGLRPKLFVQEGIKSFDVDWEEDFFLAEQLYLQLYKK